MFCVSSDAAAGPKGAVGGGGGDDSKQIDMPGNNVLLFLFLAVERNQ